jgi:hypothetical protein
MSAVLEIGFSAPAVFTGIDRVEKRLQGLDRHTQEFGRSGGIGRGLGNMSMQLQDIAVQLQSGTRASIVFAQQGSQMLSAFGPAGAVAGAVAAIGGAMWMAKEQGREAFEALNKDIKDFDSSLARLLSGSVTDLVTGLEKVEKQLQQLKQQKAQDSVTALGSVIPDGWMQKAAGLGLPVYSTESNPEQRRLEETALENKQKILDQIVATSQQEVRLMELRAVGRDRDADLMERSIRLKRVLAEIDAGPYEVRDRLKADAALLSAAEEKRTLLEAQKQLEEQGQQFAFEQLATADQINTVQQRLNDLLIEEDGLRAKGQLDALAVVGIEQRRLALQSQLNQLRSRFNDEAERAAGIAKREADEAARGNEQRRNAVMNTAQEFKLLEARATGRKRAIEDVEREIGIEQRRDRLMKENGLNKTEATALATKMQNMEEQANNGGRSPRIRGVQAEHRMSGLSSFYDLNRGPGALEKLQGRESAFDKLQRTPSAFDQLQAKGTQDRLGAQNQRNAVEPTPTKPASLEDALQKVLTILPKNLAEALLGH